jgi:uracil-DNA glycosylase
MATNTFPYINISENIRALMEFISTCREPSCLVPQRHPFYPTPDLPPFYYGKRPCLPVVPTNLATNKIMIIGEYPNGRYGKAKKINSAGADNLVPLDSINEPFEGGRYFDGYSVRDYPTFDSLDQNYLTPLGLNVRKDVWLTNINKCFLMSDKNIMSYKNVGWMQPTDPIPAATIDDYYAIASVCVARHLPRELDLCQPKLIIALGGKAYHMLHSSNDFKTPAVDDHFNELIGKVLLANDTSNPKDKRNDTFRKFNVVHLNHPSFFIRPGSDAAHTAHLNTHIPAVKTFMQSIHLP